MLELQVEENRALNEKAYIESSRILKECQTTWNAYKSTNDYDWEDKENFNYPQLFKVGSINKWLEEKEFVKI